MKAFVEYVKFCFDEFKDEVTLWSTFNEPYYSLQCMYLAGNYPPNEKDVSKFYKAGYYQLYASALAVIEFRKGNYPGEIGLVADIHPCYPKDDSEECKKALHLADNFLNNSSKQNHSDIYAERLIYILYSPTAMNEK